MTQPTPIFEPVPTRPRFVDLSNQVFGKITVLGFAGEDRTTKQVRTLWWCKCECGVIFKPRGDHLKSGNTTNCGCVRRVSVGNACRTHGHCSNRHMTPEYHSWLGMIQRCSNQADPAYKYYGGRGIAICQRWRESFEAFFADMGVRPQGHSIDRINTNGHYEPENCRWATKCEQMHNTRRNHLITFHGTTLCVTEWARKVGLSPQTLFSRLRNNWSEERALTTPTTTR